MRFEFINTKEWGIDAKGFEKCIKRLKKHVPKTEGVLNVVFVDDAYIRKLNKEYRKKDKATDVLSFSYLDAPDFKETKLIGEIYISVPTAKMNAEQLQAPDRAMEPATWTLQDELNKLLVHGVLHIFGHDHETDEEWERMDKIESEIIGL